MKIYLVSSWKNMFQTIVLAAFNVAIVPYIFTGATYTITYYSNKPIVVCDITGVKIRLR